MIAFLKGTVEYIHENSVEILCGDIGYNALVTSSVLTRIESDKHIKIYTYMQVKEDGVALFGFASREEKDMFLKLLDVSGVGAKTALAVVSSIKLSDLIMSISSADTTFISRIKGIGKKTAERIVLELKDKVSIGNMPAVSLEGIATSNVYTNVEEDAIGALMALGLSRGECLRAVNMALSNGKNTLEEIVSFALRSMG